MSALSEEVDQKEEQLKKCTNNIEDVKERYAFIIRDMEEQKMIVEAMKAE